MIATLVFKKATVNNEGDLHGEQQCDIGKYIFAVKLNEDGKYTAYYMRRDEKTKFVVFSTVLGRTFPTEYLAKKACQYKHEILINPSNDGSN